MGKYKFWDKVEDLYTPSGRVYTAQEYLSKNGWARKDDVKCIISTGPINCAVFQEFTMLRDICVQQGMTIPDGATDEEVLELMSQWEDRVIEPAISAEERTAAALEYANVLNSPDAET